MTSGAVLPRRGLAIATVAMSRHVHHLCGVRALAFTSRALGSENSRECRVSGVQIYIYLRARVFDAQFRRVVGLHDVLKFAYPQRPWQTFPAFSIARTLLYTHSLCALAIATRLRGIWTKTSRRGSQAARSAIWRSTVCVISNSKSISVH